MATLFKAGIVLLLGSLGLWFYEHEFENTLPISPDLDAWMGMAGGVCLGIFMLVYIYSLFFGVASKWGRHGRCVRCGVKIPKTEMYCEFHKNEVANEFLSGKSQDQNYGNF